MRQQGAQEFTWKGNKYTTQVKEKGGRVKKGTKMSFGSSGNNRNFNTADNFSNQYD